MLCAAHGPRERKCGGCGKPSFALFRWRGVVGCEDVPAPTWLIAKAPA